MYNYFSCAAVVRSLYYMRACEERARGFSLTEVVMAADKKVLDAANDDVNRLSAEVMKLEKELRQARADERRARARVFELSRL